MLTTIFPIFLVILSNTFYHISSKSTPKDIAPFISLSITYCIAAVFSIMLHYVTGGNANILVEVKKANWTSFLLGIAVVGLEFGYLQVYRVGWDISIGSLVSNIGLAVVLIFVGIFLYKENLNVNQMIGIAFCVLGLIFLNK